MKNRPVFILLLPALMLLIPLFASEGAASSVRIVTPYLGALTNTYTDEEQGLDLEDTALLKGLYLQWVDTERFQSNFFLYQSSNINYSNIWGFHILFDWYYDVQENQKNIIGVGTEYVGIRMDAGSNFTPLTDFTLTNNVIAPFLRAGRYFYFGPSTFRSYLLPWFGFEYELVRGDVSFLPPGPPMPVARDIHADYLLGLIGLKYKTVIHYFLDIELKSSLAFNAEDVLTRVGAMVTLYLGRHWGLSYRFLYTENISGTNLYNLGGVAVVF
jgi:hypothetical protein